MSFQKTERAAGGCLGTTEPLCEEHASSAHGQGFLRRSGFLVTPTSHERDVPPAFGEASHDLCPPQKGILGESQVVASEGRALSLLMVRCPKRSPRGSLQAPFISCWGAWSAPLI